MTLCPQLTRLKCLATVLCLVLTWSLAGAQTVDGKPEVKAEVIARVTDTISRRAFVPGIDFSRLPSFLEQEKAELDKATNDEEFARAVNAALNKFGASHIVLWTPRTSESRANASAVGIGISGRPSPEGLVILRVVPGTSASNAGLVPGDTIIEVDGKKAEGTRGITGVDGSKVNLTIKREDGQILKLDLERKKFSTLREPELTWVDRDTAKLSLYTFDGTYDAGLITDFMDRCTFAKNLIIDLRDNGGGVISNLQHFMSFFLPSTEPFGTFISKVTLSRYVAATHGDPKDLAAIANFSTEKLAPIKNSAELYKGHVIVLINHGSGSASEIAAAALKDKIGAEIIGAKSAGAVLVSRLVPAAEGFMIQFPQFDYITIKGKRLEGIGVSPDIEAKDAQYRLPNSPDASVDKALAYIDGLTHAEEQASVVKGR